MSRIHKNSKYLSQKILKNVNDTYLTTDAHVITKFSWIVYFFLPMKLR